MFGQRELTLTPDAPAAFITLAEAKAFIGITDSSSDTLLQGFCDAIPTTIEKYCNCNITPRTVAELIDLDEPCQQLVLSFGGLTTDATVSVDGVAIATGNLRTDKRAGIVRQVDGSVFNGQLVTTGYVIGYAAVPAAIKQAALVIAQEMYFANKAPGNIVSEAVEGVGSTTYESSANDMVKGPTGVPMYASAAALLGPYVRRFTL